MSGFDTASGTILKDEEPLSLYAASSDPPASAVRAELQRILASHHFHTSKRCQIFLSYAISEVLPGRRDLKKRSIGIEVFDRSPSYDTNQDPVVRLTAGDVRKRLALYY